MGRSQRRSAKATDGVPDFCGQLINMLRIIRMVWSIPAAAGNSWRQQRWVQTRHGMRLRTVNVCAYLY